MPFHRFPRASRVLQSSARLIWSQQGRYRRPGFCTPKQVRCKTNASSTDRGILDSYQTTAKKYLQSAQNKAGEWQDTVVDGLSLPQALSQMPDFLSVMKDAFEFKPKSLGAEIIQEAKESKHSKETASVRVGAEFCKEEAAFRAERMQISKAALARYLNINPDEICDADLPTIGVAASGGGLRACLNTTCYYEIMQETGLFDLTTYLAGISGSTWAQAMFFDSSIGHQKASTVLAHLKHRTSTHIVDPASNLKVLQDAKSRKYILRSLLERFHAGYNDLGLTDLYGIMLANRFFVPDDLSALQDEDLLLSNQAQHLAAGKNPMPIYSCVRHEIPKQNNAKDKEHASSTRDQANIKASEAHFQFFEFTPFEFGSEEIRSWIPTWATGRNFENGSSQNCNAEIGLSTLLGTFSSAFCAPLSSYLIELEPLIATDTQLFAQLKKQIAARDEQFKAIQMIDATRVPNFALDLALPEDIQQHMSRIKDLELSDAGMDNNLPFYPLLRRNCDIIIALDSSADIETTPWFSRTEGYAKRRKINSWPVGIEWPDSAKSADQTEQELKSAAADNTDADAIDQRKQKKKEYGLTGVNVWIGETSKSDTAHEEPVTKARMIDDDWQVVSESTGTMLIYLPMLPHVDVPDVIPDSSEHLSTWNFVYTPKQIDGVRQLARANFDTDKVKKAVEAMYHRKKQERLARANE